MTDISSQPNEAVSLFSGKLIIGNHDTITLFGSQPQSSLNDYSRRVTNIFFKETEEIDMAISNVIAEIEKFERKTRKYKSPLLSKPYRHRAIQKEYFKVISYMENMTTFFKLQQAQLLKEVKLLEKMLTALSSCAEELEHCIKTGNSVLIDRLPNHSKSGCSPPVMTDDSDLEIWYSRLEKRIEDLSISHIVSLQSKEQIKLLYNNDLIMLDKIASTISNTFPIWQTQVAIMLGIELLETRLTTQEKIENLSSVKSFSFTPKRAKEVQLFKDTERLLELNQSLTIALNEVLKLEKSDAVLRKGFVNAAQHIERGKTYD